MTLCAVYADDRIAHMVDRDIVSVCCSSYSTIFFRRECSTMRCCFPSQGGFSSVKSYSDCAQHMMSTEYQYFRICTFLVLANGLCAVHCRRTIGLPLGRLTRAVICKIVPLRMRGLHRRWPSRLWQQRARQGCCALSCKLWSPQP